MTALSDALVAAQRAISSVAKDARNNHQGYLYASAEAVIDEARRALGTAGLSLYQRSLTISGESFGKVAVVYVLEHREGESREIAQEWAWEAGKGRPADKAVAGACTTCLAYVLRGLLLIPRGIEGEVRPDERDDRDHQPSRQRWDHRRKPAEPDAAAAVVSTLESDERREREDLRRRYLAAREILGPEDTIEIGGEINGSTPTAEIRAAVTVLELEARARG